VPPADAVGPVLVDGADPRRPHVEAWPVDQVVRFFGYGRDDTMVLSYPDAHRVRDQLAALLGAPARGGERPWVAWSLPAASTG
jgi:hypothetical protein